MLFIWSSDPVNSLILPAGVIRPIARMLPLSVNHIFPSGPAVRSSRLLLIGSRFLLNSAIVPFGVTLPIALGLPLSRNQRSPSGPTVMLLGAAPESRPWVNS